MSTSYSELDGRTLPDRPSALLALALADLQRVEKDPLYTVDMSNWHQPVRVPGVPMTCEVCMAGAVLAKTLHLDREDVVRFNPHHEDDEGLCALGFKSYAIDELRQGRVERALELLGDVDGITFSDEDKKTAEAVELDFDGELDDDLYGDDPELFKQRIGELVARLEEEGL